MAGYKSKQKTTFFAKNKQSVNDSYRASNFKLSFQYLDTTQKYGSSFKDWQQAGLLSHAMETLKGYCCSPLMGQVDGFNVQEWAKRRAERRREWSVSANKKSHEYFEKSNKDRDFLSLGEPIKIGHHSERRHRKAIADAWRNMGKSVEFSDKATEHERESEYWDKRATTINLSMPESIDFYAHKLEEAKEYHEGVKSGKYPREHSYTLTYAKKAVNEAQKNYDLAVKLWG